MKTTKFNISWQLVRVAAKGIKDPSLKLSFVRSFLKRHPNVHNYVRVLNWIKMTALGYKNTSPIEAALYDTEARLLVSNKEKYAAEADMPNDFSKVSREDLQMVYDDLLKRKYGFQFKSIPQAHTDFLEQLKQYLDT